MIGEVFHRGSPLVINLAGGYQSDGTTVALHVATARIAVGPLGEGSAAARALVAVHGDIVISHESQELSPAASDIILAAMASTAANLPARATSPAEIKEKLEEFVFDNPQLERLEAILDTFNPFVAMGWTRQELRHSAFLAWLLNPSGTHGLNAYFLTIFLKRIAWQSPAGAPSVVEIDAWDFSDAIVHREWRNIDLLIQDDANRLVVAIENKVDSTEHSDQLRRYYEDVERHFPRYRKLFAYLTPGGEEPSVNAYAPIAYTEVIDIVESAVERRGEQLADDVRTFLLHYVEMLRRFIVEDSEIQKLCRTIYDRHREALEVLFEQRPDRASEVASLLTTLLAQRPDLILDHSSKTYVRFLPKSLDFLPLVGDWTPSKRMVLFQLCNSGEQVSLNVTLGPGEESVRNRIYETVREHASLFNHANQKLYPQFWSFHAEKWVTKKTYTQSTLEELRAELERHLEKFLGDHLSAMEAAFQTLRSEAVGG